jgi:hypothetical protein
MKNSNDTIKNRSRDLPVCSAVPQPLRYHVPHILKSTYKTTKIRFFNSWTWNIYVWHLSLWELFQGNLVGGSFTGDPEGYAEEGSAVRHLSP